MYVAPVKRRKGRLARQLKVEWPPGYLIGTQMVLRLKETQNVKVQPSPLIRNTVTNIFGTTTTIFINKASFSTGLYTQRTIKTIIRQMTIR